MLHKIKKQIRIIKFKSCWFWLLLILFIVFTMLTIMYGFYLNKKIRNRIDGKVWQLPAIVYGRIIDFEPDMPISKDHMITILKSTQYRQVPEIVKSGDFSVRSKSIEMIRRPFDFPDGKEGQIRTRLIFKNNRLKAIENIDNNHQFGFFRLDPRLISILSSSNSKQREQRLFMEHNSFPTMLINMLLATEDRYFYKHDGISFYSIGRAVLANLISRNRVQGASTLTQQLVKNLFLSNKKTYWRKVNEAYMAVLMDAQYSKERILELYMNEVYLGQNGDNEIRGFPLASLYYFGCPMEELSLDQQALLVGMVKGASIYNPWRNPKLALDRRNLVLYLLQREKIISQKLYRKLNNCPLGVRPQNEVIFPQPSFIQVVQQEVETKLGEKIKNLSGAKIFTTFDFITQTAAERATINGVPKLKKQKHLSDLEAAVVVIDRFSGELRAIVGGTKLQFAGYNRALQTRRSIGSLAKPAIYLTALSHPHEYRLNTLISDTPIILHQPNGEVWSPQNDNKQFKGQVMLVDALTYSLNVPTVNLGMDLGLSEIIDTWQKLGIAKNQLYPVVPAIILGALNLTPIEVAQAFQTIASGGNRALFSTVRSVISENGKVLYQSFPQAEKVFSPQAAYMTLWSMQQVIKYGTGKQLGVKYPDLYLAGKTGTTNNKVDAWFVGIDGREVVIVWVGRDNNETTRLYGANGAMVIYQYYLSNNFPLPLNLIPPKNIIYMGVDTTGNFVCSDSGGVRRYLPVWTSSPYSICQQKQQKLISNNLLDHFPYLQPQCSHQNGKKTRNEIKSWIKKLFGKIILKKRRHHSIIN